ncbi:hypothetical protein, partial [Streptacidiphilus jiangxiensis]
MNIDDHAAVIRPHHEDYLIHRTRERLTPAERLPELLASYRKADGDLGAVLGRYGLTDQLGDGPLEADCECASCQEPTDYFDPTATLQWAYLLTPAGIHVAGPFDMWLRHEEAAAVWAAEADDYLPTAPEPEGRLGQGTLVPWTTDPGQDFTAPAYRWQLGNPVEVVDTTAYRANDVTYAYRVAAYGRAEQLLLDHGCVPSGHGDQPASIGVAATRGYRLPPGTPRWVVQGRSEADRALEDYAEPVLSIYHDAVRSHRHSEDLAQVVLRHVRRPGEQSVALSGYRQLEEDL